MKKSALAVLMALGVATVAQATPRLFVQMNVGGSVQNYGGDILVFSTDDGSGAYYTSNGASGFIWRPTVGLEFGKTGNHLIAIDYTQWADEDYEHLKWEFSTDVYTIGLKYAYRFNLESTKLRPYLGARLNWTHHQAEIQQKVNYFTEKEEKYSESRFGFGAFAGVEYPIYQGLSIGVNVEANYLASNLNAYGFTAFAKYTF